MQVGGGGGRSRLRLPGPPFPVCSRWPDVIRAPTPQQGYWPKGLQGVEGAHRGWGGRGYPKIHTSK